MTLTFALDLDGVKVNQRANSLGRRSRSLNVSAPSHRQTHATPITLPGPLID